MRTTAVVTLCVALAASSPIAADPKALWERYGKGERIGLIEPLETALAENSDDADLQLILGRVLTDLDRFEEARLPLERAVALDTDRGWRTGWALAYLGNVQYALGAKDAARDTLTKAIVLNATANATNRARQLFRVTGLDPLFADWIVRETPHFVFHYAPSLDRAPFKSYEEAHEQAFDTIVKFFGTPPARKIDFFVWGDAETHRHRIELGFAVPELSIVHAHAKQTVGHEMTHVISWTAARPLTETGLINEGTAICFDQTKRDRIATARSALAAANRNTVSVEQLWADWRSLPGDAAYPVAGAFVRYLIEKGGRERFMKLLADQSLPKAREIYGDELPKIIASFEKQLAAP